MPVAIDASSCHTSSGGNHTVGADASLVVMLGNVDLSTPTIGGQTMAQVEGGSSGYIWFLLVPPTGVQAVTFGGSPHQVTVVSFTLAGHPINYILNTNLALTIPGNGLDTGMFIDIMYDNSEAGSSNNPATSSGNTAMCVLRTGAGPWEKTGSSYESDVAGDGVLTWTEVTFIDVHAGVLISSVPT